MPNKEDLVCPIIEAVADKLVPELKLMVDRSASPAEIEQTLKTEASEAFSQFSREEVIDCAAGLLSRCLTEHAMKIAAMQDLRQSLGPLAEVIFGPGQSQQQQRQHRSEFGGDSD